MLQALNFPKYHFVPLNDYPIPLSHRSSLWALYIFISIRDVTLGEQRILRLVDETYFMKIKALLKWNAILFKLKPPTSIWYIINDVILLNIVSFHYSSFCFGTHVVFSAFGHIDRWIKIHLFVYMMRKWIGLKGNQIYFEGNCFFRRRLYYWLWWFATLGNP